MGSRGRLSVAALAITSPRIEAGRPEPPDYLGKEEKKVWSKIVESLPSDWFPDYSLCLLEELVCCTVIARSLGDQIRDCRHSDERARLLKMRIELSDKILKATTRMRLTQLSQKPKKVDSRGVVEKASKVWER